MFLLRRGWLRHLSTSLAELWAHSHASGDGHGDVATQQGVSTVSVGDRPNGVVYGGPTR